MYFLLAGVIDLGPDGGKDGGHLVFQGRPEELVKVKGSWTGRFLGEKLGKKIQSKYF